MKNAPYRFPLLTAAILALTPLAWTGCTTTRTADRSMDENREDAAVTARVKAALSSDPQYKYESVVVTSFRGAVQLSGFVDSDAQKKAAGEIAEKVAGARTTENRISIKTSTK